METEIESQPSTENSRAFLQHRIRRFGLVGGLMFLAFLAWRLLGVLLSGKFEYVYDPSIAWHLFAGLSLIGVWAVARGELGSQTLRLIEGAGLCLTATCVALMGASIPHFARPEMIMVMALSSGLFARTVYVPSTGRRTGVLGAIMAVPIIGTTYWHYQSLDLDAWSHVHEAFTTATRPQIARDVAIMASAWWVLAVTSCVIGANVIYGLRREVRDIKQLGQYRLDEKLGEGGMGIVYRAQHSLLRRPTAVKLLPRDKAGDATIRRFEREVRQTARLSHPNTVTIYDYGHTSDGVFYYAMELIDGATLSEIVDASGAMPASRVVFILEHVASALAEAHGIGLVHRDIKPANIMLWLPQKFPGLDELVKVLDFGLVKDVKSEGTIDVTRTGVITGTPQYMSPEAISDPEMVDARSDLYALCAVGYYLLTGHHVFDGKSVVEVCSRHLREEPIAPSVRLGSTVPADLEEILLDGLAKNPDERPQSAVELLGRLRGCEDWGKWSPQDAESWWQEHATFGPNSTRRKRIATATTLDVRIAFDGDSNDSRQRSA